MIAQNWKETAIKNWIKYANFMPCFEGNMDKNGEFSISENFIVLSSFFNSA